MTEPLFPLPPATIRHRLFFAAIPPSDVADLLAQVWQQQGNGARFRSGTLHMTLCYAAALPQSSAPVTAALRAAGDAVRAAPFTLTFERLATFAGRPGNRALVAEAPDPAGAAQAVADALRAACLRAGLRPPAGAPAAIRPHVTLAYGKALAADLAIAAPVRWTIDTLVLIDSVQGEGRHLHLARWPLGG